MALPFIFYGTAPQGFTLYSAIYGHTFAPPTLHSR